MQLTEKQKALVPTGTHTAILYSFIDLGTHLSPISGNTQRRARLTWELCDERMDDGRPLVIGKEYNASTNEKATLAQHLKSWTGQEIKPGFVIDDMLGRACNLTVTHETSAAGAKYAAVSAIAPLKKSETPPPQVNPSVLFEMDVDRDTLDQAVFNDLPEFCKKKIMESPEYKEIVARRSGTYAPPPPPKPSDDGVPGYVTDGIAY